MKFFCLNILKTKANSMHTVRLYLQNIKKNHINQKYLTEKFEIFHQPMYAYLKTSNFRPQVIQIAELK